VRALAARWAALPAWARLVLAAYAAGFADGTAAHIRDLSRGGLGAYRHFGPWPVQAVLVGLVLLDPLAMALDAAVRRAGVWLSAAVMVLDVIANTIGNRGWLFARPGLLLHEPAVWPVPLFAVVVLGTAVPLLRVLPRSPRPAGGRSRGAEQARPQT
jgi:hypothetical protein